MSFDEVSDMYTTEVLLESTQTKTRERSYATLDRTRLKQIIEQARIVAIAARDAARQVKNSL